MNGKEQKLLNLNRRFNDFLPPREGGGRSTAVCELYLVEFLGDTPKIAAELFMDPLKQLMYLENTLQPHSV